MSLDWQMRNGVFDWNFNVISVGPNWRKSKRAEQSFRSVNKVLRLAPEPGTSIGIRTKYHSISISTRSLIGMDTRPFDWPHGQALQLAWIQGLSIGLMTSLSIGIVSRPSIGILKDPFVWHPGPSLSIGMARNPSIWHCVKAASTGMLTKSFDWHGQDLSIGIAKDSSIDISINTLWSVFGQGIFEGTESEPFEGNESESFEGVPSEPFEGAESRPFKGSHQPNWKRVFEGQLYTMPNSKK